MKHSLHGETAASVLLKLFINGNERRHNNDVPKRTSGIMFSNQIHIHFMILVD